jgi:catechol 2,3-dioxygenase-like lactoylglutathione lyase family enzyme
MLDHTGIVVTDLQKARTFYDAIAQALGLATISNSPESFLFGKGKAEPIPYLWIGTLRPSYWAEGSRPGLNQMHVAFVARNKAMVDAFYKAALAAGGRDNGSPVRGKAWSIITAPSCWIRTATISRPARGAPQGIREAGLPPPAGRADPPRR